MKRVIVESPCRAPTETQRLLYRSYLNRALRDCIERGESPYASHATLVGPLDDRNPSERALGIEAGYAWWDLADYIVFYIDHGWSEGMLLAAERAGILDKPYQTRSLSEDHTDE